MARTCISAYACMVLLVALRSSAVKIFYWHPDAEASVHGLPPCDLADPTSDVNRVRGVAALKLPHYALHHTQDQHGGPWFFGSALAAAPPSIRAEMPESADLVYVDIYCYYAWYWFSRYLTPEQMQVLGYVPEQYLHDLMLYIENSLVVSGRVEARRLVLYAAAPYAGHLRFRTALWPALQIILEQGAYCGPRPKDMNITTQRHIIAPYNANSGLWVHPFLGKRRDLALAAKDANSRLRGASPGPAAVSITGRQPAPLPPPPPLHLQRKILVTYIGGSSALSHRSAGQNLRAATIAVLRKEPDAFTHAHSLASTGQLPNSHATAVYRNSTFCIVAPGDTQASKRASEVMLHGCLPVFVGPPWSSLPFNRYINYASFAVFIEVVNTTGWVYTPKHLSQLQGASLELPDPHRHVLRVQNLGDVPAALRRRDAGDIGRRQKALGGLLKKLVWAARFSHEAQPGSEDLSATDVLLRWLSEMAASQSKA